MQESEKQKIEELLDSGEIENLELVWQLLTGLRKEPLEFFVKHRLRSVYAELTDYTLIVKPEGDLGGKMVLLEFPEVSFSLSVDEKNLVGLRNEVNIFLTLRVNRVFQVRKDISKGELGNAWAVIHNGLKLNPVEYLVRYYLVNSGLNPFHVSVSVERQPFGDHLIVYSRDNGTANFLFNRIDYDKGLTDYIKHGMFEVIANILPEAEGWAGL